MRRLVILTIPLLFTMACKTTQKVQQAPVLKNPVSVPSLKKEDIHTLAAKIRENTLKYKWISAHFSIDMSQDSSTTSFSGDIRLCKDSVIWMSIRAIMGTLEAARVMLTEDSALFINRIKDTYFKGDYEYIDNILDEDLDFDMVQSVMIGGCMEFYNDTSKMKSYFDGKEYIISTIRKRKLKKILFKNRLFHSKDDAQFIFLDSSDFHITHLRVEDFVNNRTFDAYYSDFQKVDSIMFPMHIQYVINAEKAIKIDLKYKKVILKQHEEVPFIIPKKYERIQY